MSDEPNTPHELEATRLLQLAESGDFHAAEALLPLVYDELRIMAASMFRQQPTDHTLQPTALVHEAFAKLVQHRGQDWSDRKHFCAIAATAMRQILCDHARGKRAAKRDPGGGERRRLTLVESPSNGEGIDVLVLEEHLSLLESADEQGGRVVNMRVFGGMSHPEISRVLDVSVQTVDRAWRRARAWLKAAMAEQAPGDGS